MSEIRALSDSIHRKRKEIDNLRQFIARHMCHYKGRHGCRMTRQENIRLRQLEAELELEEGVGKLIAVEKVTIYIKQAKESLDKIQPGKAIFTKEDIQALDWLLEKLAILRNSLICRYVEVGISQLKVAESFHLSPARVSQIVKQVKENNDDHR